MVATLEAAAATADRVRCLPALSGWPHAVAERLLRRWPDAGADLAAIRPYTPRA